MGQVPMKWVIQEMNLKSIQLQILLMIQNLIKQQIKQLIQLLKKVLILHKIQLLILLLTKQLTKLQTKLQTRLLIQPQTQPLILLQIKPPTKQIINHQRTKLNKVIKTKLQAPTKHRMKLHQMTTRLSRQTTHLSNLWSKLGCKTTRSATSNFNHRTLPTLVLLPFNSLFLILTPCKHT